MFKESEHPTLFASYAGTKDLKIFKRSYIQFNHKCGATPGRLIEITDQLNNIAGSRKSLFILASVTLGFMICGYYVSFILFLMEVGYIQKGAKDHKGD